MKFTNDDFTGDDSDCDAIGFSCNQFVTGVFNDLNGFTGIPQYIVWFSHYLNGQFHWYATIYTYKHGGMLPLCWRSHAACNCGAQLDRYFHITDGFTGATIPGGNSNDYIIAWENPNLYANHQSDWNIYSRQITARGFCEGH